MFSRLRLALKAGWQLSPADLAWYALYRGQVLRARLRPPAPQKLPPDVGLHRVVQKPSKQALLDVLGAEGVRAALAEADLICNGQVRLFGGEAVPLDVAPPVPLADWTAYESGRVGWGMEDVKSIWEPARFGWAFTLGRAFILSGAPNYAQTFWQYAEKFWQTNPAYQGLNWSSGQEVALRLIALVWSGDVFKEAPSSSPKRMRRLAESIAEHAGRIPPTLAYARAQNNNHLLSEAAGLLTAAAALAEHPRAARWRRLGRRWFEWGLRHQIAGDGEYVQHSANYHRLMLHLALWVRLLGERFSPAAEQGLRRATAWLVECCDAGSGGVPNLGPNDGANIFPLSGLPFEDFRPAVQAAARVFCGQAALPPGLWDELWLWLDAGNTRQPPTANLKPAILNLQPATLNRQPANRIDGENSHAFLRAVRLTSRPGHADQLHLDLWWRGLNVARDAGTFAYNAAPPWDNPLTHAGYHNTVTVNGRDQMTRAGRFLYLDWAQAEVVGRVPAEDGGWRKIVARHFGYAGLGVIIQRSVALLETDLWQVVDEMLPSGKQAGQQAYAFRLHWLLPDWPWQIEHHKEHLRLRLASPHGEVRLDIEPCQQVELMRGGECVYGQAEADPVRGWFSPAYGRKQPALSLVAGVRACLPAQFRSEFGLPLAPP